MLTRSEILVSNFVPGSAAVPAAAGGGVSWWVWLIIIAIVLLAVYLLTRPRQTVAQN